MSKLKVGDDVYIFDENRRVYPEDKDGLQYGGPIYREHFAPYRIVGTEGRSFVYAAITDGAVSSFTDKIGSAKAESVFHTADEVEDLCWINENRYRLSDEISKLRDVATLKQIAELIGYTERPE